MYSCLVVCEYIGYIWVHACIFFKKILKHKHKVMLLLFFLLARGWVTFVALAIFRVHDHV